MNIAIILASGSGTRVRNSRIPKQFIEINDKPIVLHTLEKFINNQNIDQIIIVCNYDWINYLKQIMEKLFKKANNYHIICGGLTRNDSIKKGLDYINKNLPSKKDDIILTHDAARIFVSTKIINENIEYAKKYGVVDTVVATTDTIVCSSDGKKIDTIPNRNYLYNCQTPQTFKLEILNKIYEQIYGDTSDACSLAVESGYYVHLLIGEYTNIKITTDFDLAIAEFLLKKNNKL